MKMESAATSFERDRLIVPGSLVITRERYKTGPQCPVFLIYTKGAARYFTDVKAALKWIAWPKSTPTGAAIREWFAQHEEPHLKAVEPTEVDPTANTRMVM